MPARRIGLLPCLAALAATAAALLRAAPSAADDVPGADRADGSRPWHLTFYAAQVSGEVGWEDVLANPIGSDYVHAYLVAMAGGVEYASRVDGALAFEAEGQVVYNFGDQQHWEFNLLPIVARWQRFPWSDRFASSAAFGLGLSWATEMPEVEVAIEGQSEQLLIYWVAELTAGPLAAPWALTLRLHHRSPAWGLMGEEGGVNALGLGLRYNFR
jgi:hypothetical protein